MKTINCLLLFCWLFCFSLPAANAQQKQTPTAAEAPNELRLPLAVICEGIKDFAPINQAIAFSINVGKVFCYSFFEPVPSETHIYHNWYHREKLTASLKLSLKPPSWKTYSTIQLREDDKGPWRVEITGPKGRKYRILRFSITD